MTGMERNSEVVQLAAYAPLLAHVSHVGALCPTNLVIYDNHRYSPFSACGGFTLLRAARNTKSRL